MKNKTALLLFLILTTLFTSTKQSFGTDRDSLNILFIGNSHFEYSNITEKFKIMANETGREVFVDGRIELGWSLIDHSTNDETRDKIRSKKWEYIILQGVGSVLAYPDSFPNYRLYDAMAFLKEKIHINNDSTKIMFCMPWAYEDGMTWYQGWTDTYADMQLKNYQNTMLYCEALDFMIAPVGWTWNTVLRDKNYPNHYLHLPDFSHPSDKGSYLMSLVFFSAIYLESSMNMQYLGGLEESEARYFQEVASNMVLGSLSLWNIPGTPVLGLEELVGGEVNVLYQNYPNPFHLRTQIDYRVDDADYIELSIYNQFGQKILSPVKEFKSPGIYSIILDGATLSEGIYYYTLKSSKSSITKKLILY